MNSLMLALVSILIVRYLLETLTDLLNISHFEPALPGEFREVYDSEKYSKSIRYQRDSTRFELLKNTFFIVVTVAFIVMGGFEWVDTFARGLNRGPILTGLVFAGLLSLGRGVLQLPFSLYDTFVIEERYGFNKTTWGVFVGDLLKGTLLGAILGGLMFGALIWFFDSAADRGWLYAWIALTAFQLLLTFIAPVVIMPIFNRFKPMEPGDLTRAIDDYTKAEHFSLQGVFTMDGSKRSTKANAFFTGFGRFRRLVLFDTLIERQSTEELVAVVAHEIGHFKLKHIQKSIILSIVSSGLLLFTFGLLLNRPELFEAFGMSQGSVYASLVLLSIVYSPILRVLGIFTHWLSRKHEFEADEYSRTTYGKPEQLVSALKKLSMDNLSHLTPHPLKVLLDYTHPPILRRIEAIRISAGFRSKRLDVCDSTKT